MTPNPASLLLNTTLFTGWYDDFSVVFPQGHERTVEYPATKKRIFHVAGVVSIIWHPFDEALDIVNLVTGEKQWWSDTALVHGKRDYWLPRHVDKVIREHGGKRFANMMQLATAPTQKGYGTW
jgi:hypothetical protein